MDNYKTSPGSMESKQTIDQLEEGHYSSSDIEVLTEDHDSSDGSIDIIKTARSSSPTVVKSDLHVGVNQDSCCKSIVENIPNETVSVLQCSQTKDRPDSKLDRENNMCTSYTEISSDNDSDNEKSRRDDDVAEKLEDDSSTSSISQISPNHRIQYRESEDSSDCATETLSSPLKHTHVDSYCNDDLNNESVDGDSEHVLSLVLPDGAGSAERPDSLSLPKPLQYYERHNTHSREPSNVSQSSSTDALIEEASKTPLHKQGSVTKQGDMIAFVADGLNDLIKMSSAPSRTSMSGSLQSPDTASNHSSVSSTSTSAWSDVTSSASEWSRDYSRMSRSPSILTASPDDIPPVDPRGLMDVEFRARTVAASLDHMLATLHNHLSKMSALSYHCLDAYKDGVENTCDSVDASIKAMYAMMAKCEELSKAMQPTYKLHSEIKDIQRLLDKFETEMAREDK